MKILIDETPVLIEFPVSGKELIRHWKKWRLCTFRLSTEQISAAGLYALAKTDSSRLLGYRVLQSVLTKYPDAVIDTEHNSGKGSKAGDKRKRTRRGSRGGKRARSGRSNVAQWTPMAWKTPNKRIVKAVREAFNELDEIISQGVKSRPRGWNLKRLAIEAETSKELFRAREYMETSAPSFIIALDFSGSINIAGMTIPIATIASALSEAMPMMILMDASNGELQWPLIPAELSPDGKETVAIWQGKRWSPKGWPNTTWDAIADETNARGVIYIGDWEDHFLSQFKDKVPMIGAISVYESSWRLPTLTNRHYGMKRDWPVVIGVGSAEDVATGIKLLIRAWR